MIGRIFDIQRFSVHDGPGIRTTVFMKGCSLRCPWCHNPEGLSFSLQPQFFKEECIGCGFCNGEHVLDKTKLCPTGALRTMGEDISSEALLDTVLRDREFYGTDGGITFSGGECLLQFEFVTEMLRLLKAEGISTAIDTSGAVESKNIEATLPYTDIYLYDLKCITPDLHEKFTGKDNRLILENLKLLDDAGARIWIRTPIIPHFNDSVEEMEKLLDVIKTKRNIERLTLIPYHTLGMNKYETLGMNPSFEPKERISNEKLEEYKEIFIKNGIFTD